MLDYAVCSIHNLNIYYFYNMINTLYDQNYILEQKKKRTDFFLPIIQDFILYGSTPERPFEEQRFFFVRRAPNSKKPFSGRTISPSGIDTHGWILS